MLVTTKCVPYVDTWLKDKLDGPRNTAKIHKLDFV